MSHNAVLRVEGLVHEFRTLRRGEQFRVSVDELSLPRGHFIAIQGPNGCGKTTLITVLALLRRPSHLSDLRTFSLYADSSSNGTSPREIDLKNLWCSWGGRWRINILRRKYIGFSPQQLELLPALTVRETVGSSLWLNGWPRQRRLARVNQLLTEFGLATAKVTSHRINQLSGGQQQKVTVARAIAHEPLLIFLDEPTAYLYHKDAEEALRILVDLQKVSAERGSPVTVIMITHDNHLADKFATFVVRMDVREVDGRREGYILNIHGGAVL